MVPGMILSEPAGLPTHEDTPATAPRIRPDQQPGGDEQGLGRGHDGVRPRRARGCRFEVNQTNPAEQPDMSAWQTDLAFRLID